MALRVEFHEVPQTVTQATGKGIMGILHTVACGFYGEYPPSTNVKANIAHLKKVCMRVRLCLEVPLLELTSYCGKALELRVPS